MEIRKDEKTKGEPLNEEELDRVNGGYAQKKYYCSQCQKEYFYRTCPVHHTDLASTTR